MIDMTLAQKQLERAELEKSIRQTIEKESLLSGTTGLSPTRHRFSINSPNNRVRSFTASGGSGQRRKHQSLRIANPSTFLNSLNKQSGKSRGSQTLNKGATFKDINISDFSRGDKARSMSHSPNRNHQRRMTTSNMPGGNFIRPQFTLQLQKEEQLNDSFSNQDDSGIYIPTDLHKIEESQLEGVSQASNSPAAKQYGKFKHIYLENMDDPSNEEEKSDSSASLKVNNLEVVVEEINIDIPHKTVQSPYLHLKSPQSFNSRQSIGSSGLNRSMTSQKTTKIRLESQEIQSVRDKLMISVRKRMPSSSFKPFDRAQRYSFNAGSVMELGSSGGKSVYKSRRKAKGNVNASKKSKSMRKSKEKVDPEDEEYNRKVQSLKPGSKLLYLPVQIAKFAQKLLFSMKNVKFEIP